MIAYSWGGLPESTGRWLQPAIYWAAPVRTETQQAAYAAETWYTVRRLYTVGEWDFVAVDIRVGLSGCRGSWLKHWFYIIFFQFCWESSAPLESTDTVLPHHWSSSSKLFHDWKVLVLVSFAFQLRLPRLQRGLALLWLQYLWCEAWIVLIENSRNSSHGSGSKQAVGWNASCYRISIEWFVQKIQRQSSLCSGKDLGGILSTTFVVHNTVEPTQADMRHVVTELSCNNVCLILWGYIQKRFSVTVTWKK